MKSISNSNPLYIHYHVTDEIPLKYSTSVSYWRELEINGTLIYTLQENIRVYFHFEATAVQLPHSITYGNATS
jgi:hypothetical protein